MRSQVCRNVWQFCETIFIFEKSIKQGGTLYKPTNRRIIVQNHKIWEG